MKNKRLFILLVVILILLNLWRWWPEANRPDRTPEHQRKEVAGLLTPQLSLEKAADDKTKRDIFNPVRVKKVKRPKPKIKPVKEKEPTGPTPQELARMNAENELNNIKLSGILIQSGVPTALLIYKGVAYTVTKDEEIAARFVILHIDSSSVRLEEKKHNLSRTINLGQ